MCSAVADIPFNVFDLQHMWLRTSTKEAGLGQAGGGVPGEGDYEIANNSPFVTQTEVTDHSGRGNRSGATCRPVSNVSVGCVNKMLDVGQRRGGWGPMNQCQTFVGQVLRTCSLPSPAAQRDATNVARPQPKEK